VPAPDPALGQSPQSVASVLGGHAGDGALPAVTDSLGRTWVFVTDVPQVTANLERLCLDHYRAEMLFLMDAFPERDVPGTLDHDLARQAKLEYAQKVKDGAFKLPTPGSPGTRFRFVDRPGGPEVDGLAPVPTRAQAERIAKDRGCAFEPDNDLMTWLRSVEGSKAVVLAAIRVRHPEATRDDAMRLLLEHTDAVELIVGRLGKAMARAQRTTPAA
jgi:hypothetical protein